MGNENKWKKTEEFKMKTPKRAKALAINQNKFLSICEKCLIFK